MATGYRHFLFETNSTLRLMSQSLWHDLVFGQNTLALCNELARQEHIDCAPLIWEMADYVAEPRWGAYRVQHMLMWCPERIKERLIDAFVEQCEDVHTCAQDMAAFGIELSAIMQAGRWKTATMVSRYTEKLVARRGGAAKLAALQNRL